MLEIKNIKKSFNNTTVLNDVTFSIKPGRIYGLVGKNGAGKTTIMNIIAGLIKPDSGICEIDNEKLESRILEIGKIGYLIDVPNFYDYMKIGEFIDFLMNGNVDNIGKKKIDELLDEFELKRDSLIRELSRGNRQKLGFISTVIFKPKYIILDEPTSALDPIGRNKFWNILKKLKEENVGILLSTHILSDLENICDNVGFLHDGRIEKEINYDDINNITQKNYNIRFSKTQKIDNGKINKIFKNAKLDGQLLIISGNDETQTEILNKLNKLGYEIDNIDCSKKIDLELIIKEIENVE